MKGSSTVRTWLFGPKIHTDPGVITIRSLVLDLDTVQDCLGKARELYGTADLYTVNPTEGASDQGAPVQFDETRLHTAADWELRRLMIRGGDQGHGLMWVDFRTRTQPSIAYGPATREPDGRAIANLLLNEGHARMLLAQHLMRLPMLLAALLIASWAWFCIDNRPPISLTVSGSLVVIISAGTLYDFTTTLKRRLGSRPPGHRIRNESRQQIRARRNDSRAALKQAVIQIPLTAAATFVVTWWFSR